MSGPWASVIVPVYNTEKWLPEALESIDRQSCRNRLEVLIIDDGSPDDSGRIAQEYAASHPNVRYIRQENAGLGAARNHGVREATGRYLAFLDSDDIYPPDGLHDLLTLADAEDAEVVVGDMHGLPPRPSPRWRRELVTGGARTIGGLDEAPDIVGNPSACNKVFRRDFVLAHGIQFTEGMAFEDVLFTLPLMIRASRMVLAPRLCYLYRLRGDGTSIMDARSQPKKIFQHLTIVERLAAELDGVDEGVRQAVHRWIAYMQLHYAKLAAESLDDEQLDEFSRRMAALFKDIPVDTVSEYAHFWRDGTRAVAIYEQDVAAIRDPRSAEPLRVRHGQAYVGHPHFDRYQDLLRIGRITATFTAVKPGPTTVIEGRLHLPGILATPGTVREEILLEIGDTLVRRPIEVRAVTESGLVWRCEVPVDALGLGSHALRLVIRDSGREFAVPRAGDTWGTSAVRLTDGRTARIRPGLKAPQLVLTGSRAKAALQAPVVGGLYVGLRGSASVGYWGKRLVKATVPSLRPRKTR